MSTDHLRRGARQAGGSLSILPVELLGHIFTLFCQPPSIPTNSPATVNHSPSFSAPLFLGKICGRWREITWSYPSLWTNIDLVLPTTNQSLITDLLEEWLLRSQTLPLNITFRRDETSNAGIVSNWGEGTLPLFHLISNEWERWEHLDLFIPHPHCIYRMNAKCQRLYLLRTARIRGIVTTACPRVGFLHDVPILRELDVHMRTFEVRNPYPQLTQLNASAIALDDLIRLLEYSPNLETVYIADIPYTRGSDTVRDALNLESLKSLTIHDFNLHLHRLLNALQAPSLLHLHLEAPHNFAMDSDAISPFLESYGQRLQSLTLGGVSNNFVAPLLALTPHLQELSLRRAGKQGESVFQEDLAQCLVAFEKLRCLSLHGVDGPFHSIVDSIQKRRTGLDKSVHPSGLDKLSLSAKIVEPIRMETKSRLSDEINGGMQIEFADWVEKKVIY